MVDAGVWGIVGTRALLGAAGLFCILPWGAALTYL